jgi:hypothetical protein
MTISDLHLECRAEETKLHNRIAELEAEVERMENLLAEGIHTCNPTCKRPLCVLRRENKELREELEVANEIGARHAKRVGEQAIELQALREALTRTRGQWIHSVNAEFCLAALEGGGDDTDVGSSL